jgi:Holliday junction DNA helicase RuvA
MFAYIRGTVAALESDSVILDHQGIGYRIYVPSAVLAELSVGEERKLHTYFAVREDAMQLYGFLTADDLELFRLLIGVSGIGPKGALGILGVMSGDELRFAVLSEDAAGLSKAPGIGEKTAQKVIIELKDKLDLMDAFEKKAAHTAAGAAAQENSAQSDAIMALTALGYSSTEAMRAVRTVAAEEESEDAEALIRAALKLLY